MQNLVHRLSDPRDPSYPFSDTYICSKCNERLQVDDTHCTVCNLGIHGMVKPIIAKKRSKKANAFFSGFGKNKKVVLYDTLIKNHTADELVAVLAHEIGHYKLNHVKTNMVISIITTGFMLFILSNFIFNSDISYALGGNVSFRHLEIFAFFIIYSPISSIISVLMNIKSRKNEYEADEYAVKNFKKGPMEDALRKLSKDNLTNMTPHPVYEFLNYSHPSISKRLKAIDSIN